ncbi:MAG: hypothetical protein H7Z38_12600 [Rubrivivax sp.]|nr:hypothetical protein [Pyrinomonadaceae bacterium]
MKENSSTTAPLWMKIFGAAFCLLLFFCFSYAATQKPQTRTLLGVALGKEVTDWLNEVENKLGEDIFAEFAELDPEDAGGDYTLGLSYITEKRVAVLRVDESFREKGERATEAVIGHELLHLRLRARGYPLFLFSPTVKTKKGLAVDVEQSNVNDLVSMIEHKVFAGEMRRTGFDKLVDLTNGLEAARRMGRSEDGQAEALNYARAVLEWDNPKSLDALTKIHHANGWERSLDGGRKIAAIIRASNINTPNDVAPVFLRCMFVLYGADFRVEPDRRFALAKVYPQMIIYVKRARRRSR